MATPVKSPLRIINPKTGQAFEPVRRHMALNTPDGVPFDAASRYGSHFAAWNPYLPSPDWEINGFRDRIVARVRDLVRNDGWASGAVSRIIDNTIGNIFAPISKPDYRFLAQATGIKAFDAKWAKEFQRICNAEWRSWANDPGKYADMSRSMTVNQLMRVAFRHKIVDGDAFAQIVYIPDRIGYGRARYGTAINLIDPDRISNPQRRFDMDSTRGGVELDRYGAAKGYWVRQAHEGDWFSADKVFKWDMVPRETSWGRPIMIHDYDRTRANEHRGAGGLFAPILDRLRMLAKYDRTELDAAIINATFAAVITSPMDQQLVEQAMSSDEFELNQYQTNRGAYHADRRLTIGDSRMLNLFPGEELTTVEAARPSSNFGDFQRTYIRYCASALGMTEQQFSQDWTSVNFSSARAALLEVWKTTQRRRDDFGSGFGMQVRIAFMEEMFDVAEGLSDIMPQGAPDFAEFRAAYAACIWAGPGRGYPDPVADREGAVLGMTSGMTTLEKEVLDGSGEDYEAVLEQRKIESDYFKELGLPEPEWLGSMGASVGNKDQPKQNSPNKSGSHDPSSPNYRSKQKGDEK